MFDIFAARDAKKRSSGSKFTKSGVVRMFFTRAEEEAKATLKTKLRRNQHDCCKQSS